MTEKELHKLRRQDLLQLLVAQTKEAAGLREELEAVTESRDTLSETLERLKARLDEKDAQLEHLKRRLDEKDSRIREMREAGSIRTETLLSIDLEELFETGRRAAEDHLKQKLSAQGLLRQPGEEPAEEAEPAVIPEDDSAPDSDRAEEEPEPAGAPAEEAPNGQSAVFTWTRKIKNYLLLTL